jgi:transposase
LTRSTKAVFSRPLSPNASSATRSRSAVPATTPVDLLDLAIDQGLGHLPGAPPAGRLSWPISSSDVISSHSSLGSAKIWPWMDLPARTGPRRRAPPRARPLRPPGGRCASNPAPARPPAAPGGASARPRTPTAPPARPPFPGRVCPPRKGGTATGRNPTDRGKPGTTHHLAVDRGGIPLAARLSGAERPDDGLLEAVLEAIPPLKGRRGRPCRRPGKGHADEADDVPHCRRSLRRRGIGCRIARKGLASKARLGRHRWVAERTSAWLHRCKRLLVRHARLEEQQQACLDLGCALICFRFVQRLE